MPYYEIGDKAIVIGGIDMYCRAMIGEIVVITSPLIQGFHVDHQQLYKYYLVNGEKIIWEESTGRGYTRVAFRPSDLKPYYDGNELVSWDTCDWIPKEEVTI